MINNFTFVENAKSLLKIPTTFVWGTSGQYVDDDIINDAILNYPRRYDSALISKLKSLNINTRCFECTGVIKFCAEYTSQNTSLSADEMYNNSQVKGHISCLPEIPGIIVHMSGHCGIYVGNNEVIEATYSPQFGFGVVKTKLSDRLWLAWYKCNWINYMEEIQ